MMILILGLLIRIGQEAISPEQPVPHVVFPRLAESYTEYAAVMRSIRREARGPIGQP